MNYLTTSNSSFDTIKRALYTLDSNCNRKEWVTIAAALKSELGDQGEELFNAWSSTGNVYKEKDCLKFYRKLQPHTATIATLFFKAQQLGFKFNDSDNQVDVAEQQRRQRALKKLEKRRKKGKYFNGDNPRGCLNSPRAKSRNTPFEVLL